MLALDCNSLSFPPSRDLELKRMLLLLFSWRYFLMLFLSLLVTEWVFLRLLPSLTLRAPPDGLSGFLVSCCAVVFCVGQLLPGASPPPFAHHLLSHFCLAWQLLLISGHAHWCRLPLLRVVGWGARFSALLMMLFALRLQA